MHIKKIEHNDNYSKIIVTSSDIKLHGYLIQLGCYSHICFPGSGNDILFRLLGIDKYEICKKLNINYSSGDWPETTPENAIKLLNFLYKPNMYDEF